MSAFNSSPRVLSLVPSWTETLLEAGIDVVGRTRFCIHPEEKIAKIPAVGGTKGVEWSKWAHLPVDVVLMDREENTKEMAESCPWPIIDTHVDSLQSSAIELERLGREFSNSTLKVWSSELKNLLAQKSPRWDWRNVPGALEWITPLKNEPKQLIYLIWKNPWMSVSQETYIGSMLCHLGAEPYLIKNSETKYPVIELSQFQKETTLLLCSSEPFPFAKNKGALRELGFPSVLVDGESWSWFGIRSLKFLRSAVRF